MRFTEWVENNTDTCDPVMVEITKELGLWSEDDEALQHAVARGDDEEAQDLWNRLGFEPRETE